MRTEVNELRGSVETIQFNVDGMAQRSREQYVDLDSRIQELQKGSVIRMIKLNILLDEETNPDQAAIMELRSGNVNGMTKAGEMRLPRNRSAYMTEVKFDRNLVFHPLAIKEWGEMLVEYIELIMEDE